MHYIIYKITNTINGKIYVGAHQTDNIDDGYMGSGKHLKRAVRKYGIENFTKLIISEHNSKEEMFLTEKSIVTDDFVNDPNTYNLKEGGSGGSVKGRIVSNETKEKLSKHFKGTTTSLKGKSLSEEHKKKLRKPKRKNKDIEINNINHVNNIAENVDLTKYGWISEAQKLTNLSHTHIRRIINKYYDGHVYKR